mmetsp:Transcript_5325/g.15590  ORF Transcript_5325/g.15590 Transcript_5325/m.15590 type:complete len:232 (-) Transcript_5325:65-760(-)
MLVVGFRLLEQQGARIALAHCRFEVLFEEVDGPHVTDATVVRRSLDDVFALAVDVVELIAAVPSHHLTPLAEGGPARVTRKHGAVHLDPRDLGARHGAGSDSQEVLVIRLRVRLAKACDVDGGRGLHFLGVAQAKRLDGDAGSGVWDQRPVDLEHGHIFCLDADDNDRMRSVKPLDFLGERVRDAHSDAVSGAARGNATARVTARVAALLGHGARRLLQAPGQRVRACDHV